MPWRVAVSDEETRERRPTSLRTAGWAVTVAVAVWVACSFHTTLPFGITALTVGFAIGRVPGAAGVAAALSYFIADTGRSIDDLAMIALSTAVALVAALVFRRAPRRHSEPVSAVLRLAALMLIAIVGGIAERWVGNDRHTPDLGDTAYFALTVLCALALAGTIHWRPRRSGVDISRFATMLVVFTATATQVFSVQFWLRQDDALLFDVAESSVLGFQATLDANLNTLGVKASTASTDPFTAERFPILMQTTVFGPSNVTGVSLVRLERNDLTAVAALSRPGAPFEAELDQQVQTHLDLIAQTLELGIPTLLDIDVFPNATGGSEPHLLYSFPLPSTDPNATSPDVLVAALSIPDLVNDAIATTRAAQDEATVRLYSSLEARDVLVWSTDEGWFPLTQPEAGSLLPSADIPTDEVAERSVQELAVGDRLFTIVAVGEPSLGSPPLFRRLVVTLETLVGLLVLSVIVATRNAAERRERERERREALLGAALEGAAGWTAIVDDTDHVVMANRGPNGVPAGAALTDAPIWTDDDARSIVAGVLAEARHGRPATAQQVWSDPADPSGAMRIFEIEARPLPDPALVYLQCIDVTENRDRAMRTAQSERMEAIGVLAGGLAHDFNNLLFITLGYLQMLERQPLVANDSQANTYVRRAVEAVERGAVVAKSLLSFARSQPLAAQQLDMHEFVDNLRPLVEQALGPTHKLSISLEGDDLFVVVDPGRLSSGLLNIVFNARDAMEQPGSLRVHVARVMAAPVDGDERDVVAISVTDTGKGLPPEVLARAFDPFFTTKKVGSGTGLGLSTVYSFAQQSGGWAGIESSEGKGATVTIYLPAVHGTAKEVVHDAPLQTAATRALVVDDEPALADLVAGWLEQFGMETKVANTPHSALRVAHEFHPHLLVSDANLGDAIDGLELARLLVEQDPALMVVFMTGFSDRIKALQRAGVATLAKPFSSDDLHRTLSTHLGERFAENARRDGNRSH